MFRQKNNIFISIQENKYYDIFMFLNICGYALFKFSYRPLGDIFQTSLFVGLIPFLWLYWKPLFKQKVFLLFVFAFVVEILSWLHGRYFTPTPYKMLHLGKLLKVFFFIVIAFQLKGDTKRILIVLGMLSLGLLLNFLIKAEYPVQEFISIFHGARGLDIDFGLINHNRPIALAAASIIVLFFIMSMCNKVFSNISLLRLSVFNLYLISMILINSVLVYASLSREAWLGLLCFMILTPILYACFFYSFRKIAMIFLIIFIVFFASIYFLSFIPTIHDRVFSDLDTWRAIWAFDFANLSENSGIGLRIKIALSAMQWINEYPLLGLGNLESRVWVLQNSHYLSEWARGEMGHFHNGYIELLVACGFLGLSVIIGLYAYMLLVAYNFPVLTTYRHIIFYFFLGFVIYYFTINLFESFFVYKETVYVNTVILGCLYSIPMWKHINAWQEKNGE